jgi:hypothetical protein
MLHRLDSGRIEARCDLCYFTGGSCRPSGVALEAFCDPASNTREGRLPDGGYGACPDHRGGGTSDAAVDAMHEAGDAADDVDAQSGGGNDGGDGASDGDVDGSDAADE